MCPGRAGPSRSPAASCWPSPRPRKPAGTHLGEGPQPCRVQGPECERVTLLPRPTPQPPTSLQPQNPDTPAPARLPLCASWARAWPLPGRSPSPPPAAGQDPLSSSRAVAPSSPWRPPLDLRPRAKGAHREALGHWTYPVAKGLKALRTPGPRLALHSQAFPAAPRPAPTEGPGHLPAGPWGLALQVLLRGGNCTPAPRDPQLCSDVTVTWFQTAPPRWPWAMLPD